MSITQLPLQAIPTDPQQFMNQYGSALLNFVVTLLIFVISFLIIYAIVKPFLVKLTRRGLNTRDFPAAVVGLAASIAGIIALVGALTTAATIAGFGAVLTAFATISGALALAFGFAAQDLLANFVAGIFILKDKPFKTGDYIEWNGNSGIVREIEMRVTKLDSFDNELITVPNSDLASSVVTNPVANDTRRVSYDFGISYTDNIDRAQELILEEARSIEGVLSDPAPQAPVTDLGGSSVVITGRVWIDPNETGAAPVRAAFVKAVKQRFDAESIEMPYSHTELVGSIDINGSAGLSSSD
ncbi:mechanosensitive ion channel family protein [Haladaptatus sp. DYF46]|uniref:mechanosensitive ion channel family protein n=1 Tax=Haladaptatus sp. DYF46 TaxID=2886041 RepID=UPI001E331E42|nr:mechanosensitive ion channel family protein [Haladaptatus sp. DYF46]